jgi:hypothetical protein
LGSFGSDQVLFDSDTLAATIPVGVSQSDYATAARTADGSYVVVYMPTARTVTVDMSSLKGPATAKWFDPTNGTYRAVQGGQFPNKGTRQFTPPAKNRAGDSDWVLLLHALSR